ncbi:MAG: hypothetical protein E7478_07390 [Ruminococcaceae bacterium]|nr:hypothetical protein [Oscillospiraceae bacterium]
MHHIFMINPAAGKKDCSENMRTMIESICINHDIEPLIFTSEYPGYEREMTEKLCDLFPGEEVRFYSIGGSGTLTNIVSGIRDFSKTEVACYPVGLTNDFLKSFGKSAPLFRSIDALIKGRVELIDIIDINGYKTLDFASFGLGNSCFSDALPFKFASMISSNLVYSLSVVVDLLRNKCGKYKIEIDGKDCTGEYAMVVCFNGMCMGGNVIPLRDPRPNDRMLNFLLVSKMSRLKQLRTVSDFAKGKLAKHKNYIRLVNGRYAEISKDNGKPTIFNCDGECVMGLNNVVKLSADKLRFIVPENAHILAPTDLDPKELF